MEYTYKFEKHLWALNLLKLYILKDKIRISKKEMYNLYKYLTSYSVFLRKTMKKFSSLPLKSLKSPKCENVLNHLYHVFST